MEKRHILWWMLIFVSALGTWVSFNINIAIVSMVNFHENEKSNQSDSVVCSNSTHFMKNFLVGKNPSKSSNHLEKGSVYNWSRKEQNTVLSGSHWLSYLAILPAGVLTQKYGSKKVVGFSLGIASVMSSLIPIFAGSGYLVVAWIRAVQGFLTAMSVPAGMYTIIGNWSPPQERTMFGSAITVGSGIGFAIGNFCFGYISENFHWHYIFHLTSICGIIWQVLWYFTVYDDPLKHPKITPEEKAYLVSSLPKTKLRIKDSIPWKKIITSVPFIVCILGINSSMWYFFMMTMYIPIYLKSMYGLNAQEIGTITSFPPLVSCVLISIAGYYSDHLVKNGKFSLNMTRKTWAVIGGVFSSVPLIFMVLVKCDVNVIIICISFAFLLRCFSMFGSPLAIVDMSPKFCGILNGISGTITRIEIFLFALIISHLSGILDTASLWAFVFVFTASFAIVTNLIFVVFGSAKEQPWNYVVVSSTDEKK